MGLLSDAKQYWWDDPQRIGYDAYNKAIDAGSRGGEWSQADAAKHMAWQAELAKRTGLPAPLAIAIANSLGFGKEVVVDGVGSVALAINDYIKTGKWDSPIDTIKNSAMDIRNNYIGASQLRNAPDIASAAAQLSRRATDTPLKSLFDGLPYARNK